MIQPEALCEESYASIPAGRSRLPFDCEARWQRFRCEACGTEALSDPKAQLFCWPCAFSFFAVEEPQP